MTENRQYLFRDYLYDENNIMKINTIRSQNFFKTSRLPLNQNRPEVEDTGNVLSVSWMEWQAQSLPMYKSK